LPKNGILGLDVAVQHALLMGRLHGRSQLQQPVDGLWPGHRQPVLEGLAGQQLHHQVESTLVLAKIEQPGDVRMAKLAERLHFATEARQHLGPALLAGLEQLEGHLLALMVDPIDHRGHALTQRLSQSVGTDLILNAGAMGGVLGTSPETLS